MPTDDTSHSGVCTPPADELCFPNQVKLLQLVSAHCVEGICACVCTHMDMHSCAQYACLCVAVPMPMNYISIFKRCPPVAQL